MGAITELPIPQTGAITSLPLPETRAVVPTRPDQQEIDAFNATSGSFAKGLRAGFNGLGSTLNSLVGQAGEAMGLTEFANTRFNEAAHYAEMADAIGPSVRDYRQVKNFTDAADYVAGLAGQAVASSVPAIAGGLIARNPLVGVAAGSFAPEAGEQVQRLRADPVLAKGMSPTDLLGNAVAKGGINAALDAGFGVSGGVVRRLRAPMTAERGILKEVGREGLTEIGQERTGQVLHSVANPDRKTEDDVHDLINAGIGGVVGGGTLSGPSHALSALPAATKEGIDAIMASPTVDKIKGMFQREKPPEDPNGLPDIPPEIDDVSTIADMIGEHSEKAGKALGDFWEKVKDRPEYKKFSEWRNDPEAASAMVEQAKGEFAKADIGGKIKAAIDGGQKAVERFTKGLKGDDKKSNLMRTEVDEEVHDNVLDHLPDGFMDHASGEDLLRLSSVIKNLVLHGANADDHIDPYSVKKLFGDKMEPLLQKTSVILQRHGLLGESTKLKQSARRAKDKLAWQDREMRTIVREHLRPSAYANPEQRKALIEELGPMLLDHVNEHGEEHPKFKEAMYAAFGTDQAKVMERFDALRKKGQDPLAWDTRDHTEKLDSDENVDDNGALVREPEVYKDVRLGTAFDTYKDAKAALEGLREQYGKVMQFRIVRDEKGRHEIIPQGLNDETGFDDAAWEKIKLKGRFENEDLTTGTATVRTKQHSSGEKINLASVTAEMMRRVPSHEKGNVHYVAEMFKQGMSQLLSDPRVLSDPFSDFTKGQLKQDSEGGWNLPDNAVVAVLGKGENRRKFTYGEIRKASLRVDPTAGKIRDRIKKAKTPEKRKEAWLELSHHHDLKNLDRRLADRAYEAALEVWQETNDADKAREEFDSFSRNDEGGYAPGNYFMDRAQERLDEEIAKGDLSEVTAVDGQGDALNDSLLARQGSEKGESEQYFEQDTGQSKMLPRSGGAPTTAPAGKTVGAEQRAKKLDRDFNRKGPSYAADGEYEPFPPNFSKMKVGKEQLSAKMEKEIRAYVEKVLGPGAKVMFEQMAEAGSFANLSGVETLKIAMGAIDKRSVAAHEAFHGLFARLLAGGHKEIANTLVQASQSPVVQAQLRQLLAKHPEALAQLSSPEERLAYMYQFWAAGKLTIGPKTKTAFDKIKDFMRKVAAVFFESFRDITALERAEQLFQAFHDGELANPSTIAEVLGERFQKTAWERAQEVGGPVAEFASKLISTSDAVVRDMNIPALNNIVNRFAPPTSTPGKDPGFLAAKERERNKRIGEFSSVIGDATAAQQREALEHLQAGTDSKKKDIQALVEGTRKFLRSMYTYQVDAGVERVVGRKGAGVDTEPLGDLGEKYFPRVYDKDFVNEHKDEFIELLNRNGVPKAQAADVVARILEGMDEGSPDETDYHTGLTYFAPQTQKRTLVNIPDAELAPYLQKDLMGTVATYVHRAARRAEYTRRFGNAGEVIAKARETAREQGMTEEQEKTFNQYVMAMEGTLGANFNPALKQVFSAIVTYQNVRLLPLALFSSLVDPLGLLVRGSTLSESFGAFKRGVTDLFKLDKDGAYDLAATVGAINAAEDTNLVADMYGSQFMTGWQRRANNLLFKWNGMESWNRSMRVAAAAAAEQFIIRHAKGENEHSERYLTELGLTKADVKVSKGALDSSDPKMQSAIAKWVDSAVLRPNASQRPIWMSDPRFMLIGHLKQFTYSFSKVIVDRSMHELRNGNNAPALALLAYVPFSIASDVFKTVLTPGQGDDTLRKGWGLGDYVWNGVQRAGIAGPGQFALDSTEDLARAKLGIESVAGPTAQQILDFAHASAGNGTISHQLVKAMPGYIFVK